MLRMALKKFREKKKRCRVAKVPRGPATKQDLNEAVNRILAAITAGPSTEDMKLLNRLLKGAKATSERLEALDAKTP